MNKKKINLFDLFFALAFLCMLFTVGFHLGKERYEKNEDFVLVTVNLEKIKGEPKIDGICLIDGKYECKIQDFNENSITLLCCGNYYEAGFLFYGAKYISKNQPIESNQNWGYFKGRITQISTLK